MLRLLWIVAAVTVISVTTAEDEPQSDAVKPPPQNHRVTGQIGDFSQWEIDRIRSGLDSLQTWEKAELAEFMRKDGVGFNQVRRAYGRISAAELNRICQRLNRLSFRDREDLIDEFLYHSGGGSGTGSISAAELNEFKRKVKLLRMTQRANIVEYVEHRRGTIGNLGFSGLTEQGVRDFADKVARMSSSERRTTLDSLKEVTKLEEYVIDGFKVKLGLLSEADRRQLMNVVTSRNIGENIPRNFLWFSRNEIEDFRAALATMEYSERDRIIAKLGGNSTGGSNISESQITEFSRKLQALQPRERIEVYRYLNERKTGFILSYGQFRANEIQDFARRLNGLGSTERDRILSRLRETLRPSRSEIDAFRSKWSRLNSNDRREVIDILRGSRQVRGFFGLTHAEIDNFKNLLQELEYAERQRIVDELSGGGSGGSGTLTRSEIETFESKLHRLTPAEQARVIKIVMDRSKVLPTSISFSGFSRSELEQLRNRLAFIDHREREELMDRFAHAIRVTDFERNQFRDKYNRLPFSEQQELMRLIEGDSFIGRSYVGFTIEDIENLRALYDLLDERDRDLFFQTGGGGGSFGLSQREIDDFLANFERLTHDQQHDLVEYLESGRVALPNLYPIFTRQEIDTFYSKLNSLSTFRRRELLDRLERIVDGGRGGGSGHFTSAEIQEYRRRLLALPIGQRRWFVGALESSSGAIRNVPGFSRREIEDLRSRLERMSTADADDFFRELTRGVTFRRAGRRGGRGRFGGRRGRGRGGGFGGLNQWEIDDLIDAFNELSETDKQLLIQFFKSRRRGGPMSDATNLTPLHRKIGAMKPEDIEKVLNLFEKKDEQKPSSDDAGTAGTTELGKDN